MAASTAISASSEYGGRRSRYGSTPARRGAIEYSTGELDIFPGKLFPRGVSEQRCRVIRDYDRHPMIFVNLASQLPDWCFRVEQRLRRECAQRKNDFRPDQIDLANKIRTARS